MDNHLKCNLCDNKGLSILYDGMEKNGKSYNLYQCNKCGLGVTCPVPDKVELEKLYASDNYRAHERRFIFPFEQISVYLRGRRLKKINKLVPIGRMLDIGCGRGAMLSMAKKEGWDVYGLEFSDDTAFHARENLGIDVKTGSIQEAGFEAGTFDVITIWHVLEHLEDPMETIRECSKLLKPGSCLIVSVPNLYSIQSQLSKRHWFHLDVPYHLYHFSENNLSRMLNMCGFSVLEINHFSFEQSQFGFIQSLFNMTSVTNNFLYDSMKSKELRKGNTRMDNLRNLFITVLLFPLIFLLSLVLTGIEVVLRRGGSIAVYARKEDT